MIQKKLQKGSDYDKYDLDGDGIVDDDELLAAEKLHEIEAAEKQEAAELRKMTAQRRMATAVLCFMALYTLLMFMPYGYSHISSHNTIPVQVILIVIRTFL